MMLISNCRLHDLYNPYHTLSCTSAKTFQICASGYRVNGSRFLRTLPPNNLGSYRKIKKIAFCNAFQCFKYNIYCINKGLTLILIQPV